MGGDIFSCLEVELEEEQDEGTVLYYIQVMKTCVSYASKYIFHCLTSLCLTVLISKIGIMIMLSSCALWELNEFHLPTKWKKAWDTVECYMMSVITIKVLDHRKSSQMIIVTFSSTDNIFPWDEIKTTNWISQKPVFLSLCTHASLSQVTQ